MLDRFPRVLSSRNRKNPALTLGISGERRSTSGISVWETSFGLDANGDCGRRFDGAAAFSAPPPLHELVACGPLSIRVRFKAQSARALVCDQTIETAQNGDWCELEIASVLDHEVVVLEAAR